MGTNGPRYVCPACGASDGTLLFELQELDHGDSLEDLFERSGRPEVGEPGQLDDSPELTPLLICPNCLAVITTVVPKDLWRAWQGIDAAREVAIREDDGRLLKAVNRLEYLLRYY